MSKVDTCDEAVPVTQYVGWIWATGALAILSWAATIALVVVDALDDLPNPITTFAIAVAATATIVCTQTALAYAQRLATCTASTEITRHESEVATTIQMRRVGHVYGASRTVVTGGVDGMPSWPVADRDQLRDQLAGAVPLAEAKEMNRVSFELGKRVERRRHDG